MEVWGPKLPRGWRYPAGRRGLRKALGDVANVSVVLYQQWSSRFHSPQENRLPVVATATFWAAVESDSPEPRVAVYGQRDSEYPDAASQDFLDKVLPRVHSFLLETPNEPGAIARSQRPLLRVLWRDGRHVFSVIQVKAR